MIDDEPEAPRFDFHVRELEQKNCPVSREFPETEPPVHHPCEDLGIDLRWPNLVLRPTLAPHAEASMIGRNSSPAPVRRYSYQYEFHTRSTSSPGTKLDPSMTGLATTGSCEGGPI